MKLRIRRDDDEVEAVVWLETTTEGVDLKAALTSNVKDDWFILSLTPEGVRRYESVKQALGFKLDDRGRVVDRT
jgi:hypothetical protein